ncbi:hypothetical protein KIN20_023229 [Parelaphostrongylus tenuis]|uniref:LITAF domain-containing protein n=1 Tax=Parelaphostrongylus tenuis TaxID=148309 RepID=A0AAD5N8T4_PARTN|nr:hypothetical protein KIN20_023210 [Parelaphostrongylus tenuis]KAJ1363379.1 hypothetical protein KIN20_023229 [Parelaphostrongylus tenuis]
MDVKAEMQEDEKDQNRKKLELCPECHQMAVEKRFNRLGVLCCISTWWICCLGLVFCLYDIVRKPEYS